MKFNLNLEAEYNKETNTYSVSCEAPGGIKISGISTTDFFIAFNRMLFELNKYIKVI